MAASEGDPERRNPVPHKDLAAWTPADYEQAAAEYCESLPLEHFMEATAQSTQRKITVESLDLVTARRPEIQVFSELLVQYPINAHLGQVVPDNMIVVSSEPLVAGNSFNLPFQPVGPFWVLEYVSSTHQRKDYHDSFLKYQDDLKVPYYLTFQPEAQDLRLHRHNGFRYERVAPNASGRLVIPELDLEIALLNGWVRFWYQGELLPLPADLQEQVDHLSEELDKLERELDKEKTRSHRQKQRAQREKQRAEQEKQRAEQEKQRAEQEKQRAEMAEAELTRLRALVEQFQGKAGRGKKPRSGNGN
jgi:Uma2 family endonuclease